MRRVLRTIGNAPESVIAVTLGWVALTASLIWMVTGHDIAECAFAAVIGIGGLLTGIFFQLYDQERQMIMWTLPTHRCDAQDDGYYCSLKTDHLHAPNPQMHQAWRGDRVNTLDSSDLLHTWPAR